MKSLFIKAFIKSYSRNKNKIKYNTKNLYCLFFGKIAEKGHEWHLGLREGASGFLARLLTGKN